MTKLTVAHHFAPAPGQLLAAHPAVGDIRAIDTSQRWSLPTDVDGVVVVRREDAASQKRCRRP